MLGLQQPTRAVTLSPEVTARYARGSEDSRAGLQMAQARLRMAYHAGLVLSPHTVRCFLNGLRARNDLDPHGLKFWLCHQ